MAIASFLDDAWDATGGQVVDVATSAWNTAVDAVPGARAVADAVDSVTAGPVRDFARTAVGRTLLTALASSLTGGLAPMLGPQLATVAFALPGLAQGDDFVTAWTQEFAKRVEDTAEILGADGAAALFAAQFETLAAYLADNGIDLSATGLTIENVKRLAKAAGISEYVAAKAIAGAVGLPIEALNYIFDIPNGRAYPAPSVARDRALADAANSITLKQIQEAAALKKRQNLISTSNSFRLRDVAPAAIATPKPMYAAVAPPAKDSGLAKKVAIGAGIVAVAGVFYYAATKKKRR